jgi:DNA-binding transcriptional LysR family regulator
MKPDFNRLHIFYQVYRHGSVAKAALELCITQSAVSQNLQKLEQELNISLFHRLPKKLVPTSSGQHLYQVVMPFYSTLDSNLKSINDAENMPQGLIKIGAPPVFGAEFLPGVLSEFRVAYPGVTFELMLGDQLRVISACRSNELDIALVDIFGNKEEESWNLIQIPIIDEPLVLAGSCKYITEHLSKDISAEALQKCQFIAYKSHAPELTDWFFHHFGCNVKQFDIVLTVESVHAVINAVCHDMGLGIIPKYMVQKAIERKELELVSGRTDEIRSRLSFVRHPGRKMSLAERLVIDLLKSKFKTG